MASDLGKRAPISPSWDGALQQLPGSAPVSTAPVAPGRRGKIAFAVATILHCLLGILWALVVLVAISLRDCFFTCEPATAAERHTDVAVWCVGGLTWAALLAFILLSRGKERVYLALALVPI